MDWSFVLGEARRSLIGAEVADAVFLGSTLEFIDTHPASLGIDDQAVFETGNPAETAILTLPESPET